MEEAVDRVLAAVREKQRITVDGDYVESAICGIVLNTPMDKAS
jgi:hypothetical protein